MKNEKEVGIQILRKLPEDISYLIWKRFTVLEILENYHFVPQTDKFSCLNRKFFHLCLRNHVKCLHGECPVQKFDEFMASTSRSLSNSMPEASFDHHLAGFISKLSTSSRKPIQIHFKLVKNYSQCPKLQVVDSEFDYAKREANFTLGYTNGHSQFIESWMDLSTDFDRISTILDSQKGNLYFSEIKEVGTNQYGLAILSKSLLHDLDPTSLLVINLLPSTKPMMTMAKNKLYILMTLPTLVKIIQYDLETKNVIEKDILTKRRIRHIIACDDTISLLFFDVLYLFKVESNEIIETDKIYTEPIKLNDTCIVYITGYWPNDFTRLYNINMLHYNGSRWKKTFLHSAKTILPWTVPKTCNIRPALVLKPITSQIFEVHYMMRGRNIYFQENDGETPRMIHKDKLVDKTLFPQIYRLSYEFNA
ncbi:unnamed protein product [Bursaphelenchus xylophilus]|uniref:(pine wood nematode) hypothetical protein n=1 Tax=Bursaphelenchus xylophilus TaxID=6326 RepID=A0A1I7RI82_BURXY|nr:unnamed protein product [Bursaphelenchus xylophilus]CAG9115090.1 unnamed protein product [Bursaphelenchus xylophilus]